MRPLLACLLALPALAADPTQISITPLNLTFAWQLGSTGTSPQAVILTSPQSAIFTATRPASAPWLQFNANGTSVSGSLPVVFPIGVDGSKLATGTSKSSVQFQTPAGTLQVNISLLVSGLPVLVASPAMVAFDATASQPGQNLTTPVGIFNSSGAFVLLGATTTTPWLTAKASGAIVQITADPTKVPGDIATGSVSVTVPKSMIVGNNPLVIPVVFLRKGFLSQGPNVTRMVNAATYLDADHISPGEIVTLGGTALGPASPAGLTLNSDGTVATGVAGVQVLFNGVPGPLVYASANLVSAVAPYELAGSDTASVQVVYNGVGSNVPPSVPVAAAVPGVFTANSAGSGPGAILNQDNSVNSPANPAPKGTAVVIYATGEGQTKPQGITGQVTTVSNTPPLTPEPAQPVTVQIDGQPATVLFAGEAPGLVSGVLQVNVQVPENARSGDLPVTISVGGIASQTGVTVSVR